MGCRDCSPSSRWVMTPPGQLRVSASPPPALWHCRLAGRLAAREADPAPQPPGRRVSLPGSAPARPARRGAKRNTPLAWEGSSGGGKRSPRPTLCPLKGAGGVRQGPALAGCRSSGGALTRTGGSRGSRPAAGSAAPPGTPAASCRRWRGVWSPGRLRSVGTWSGAPAAVPSASTPSHAAFRERLGSGAGRGGAPCTRRC